MLGVPAASTATTAGLFLVGLIAVALCAFFLRRRFAAFCIDAKVAALATALSLIAAPWIAWRFVEDLSLTTGLDAYTRSNSGPIQAYLPGYLVDSARGEVGPRQTWHATSGPGVTNAIAARAFPSLVLVALFPRVSAPAQSADYVLVLGGDPRRVAKVHNVRVVHAAIGNLLPAVKIGRAAK